MDRTRQRSVGAVLCRSSEKDWDVSRELKCWVLGEWLVLLPYDGDSGMRMEEVPEICGALRLKRNDASLHFTILVSFKTKTDIESQKTLQYSNERCPKGTLVGHQKNGIRNPVGSAPPSKTQDRGRRTSGKAQNLEQS